MRFPTRTWHPTQALARRLGISDGQAVTLTVTVMLTLALTLGGLPPVFRGHADLASGQLAPRPPASDEAATALPPLTEAPQQDESTRRPVGASPPPAAPPDTIVVESRDAPPTPEATNPPPRQADASPPRVDDSDEPPCSSDPTGGPAEEALFLVDEASGGKVPDNTIAGALALITGCQEADPVIIVLALLIELGQSLPDPGLELIELPALPYVELPEPLVAALQGARPALDPACEVLGAIWAVMLIAGPAYPYPVDAVFVSSLFYAAAACGQLQDASSVHAHADAGGPTVVVDSLAVPQR